MTPSPAHKTRVSREAEAGKQATYKSGEQAIGRQSAKKQWKKQTNRLDGDLTPVDNTRGRLGYRERQGQAGAGKQETVSER